MEMSLRDLVERRQITRDTAIEKTGNPAMFEEQDSSEANPGSKYNRGSKYR
jgi:hypothetical protein